MNDHAPPLPTRADDHYGATDRPRPVARLTPADVATILAALARTPSSLSVDTAFAAVASLITTLLGDVWVEVSTHLLDGAWASIRTDRARGLRYLAIVVGDVEGTWGPQYPAASEPLQELRRCLVAASKAEPRWTPAEADAFAAAVEAGTARPVSMLSAAEPPGCLAGGVTTRADAPTVEAILADADDLHEAAIRFTEISRQVVEEVFQREQAKDEAEARAAEDDDAPQSPVRHSRHISEDEEGAPPAGEVSLAAWLGEPMAVTGGES